MITRNYLSVLTTFVVLVLMLPVQSMALTFTQAKKEAVKIYHGHEEAFYSGCRYGYKGKKLVPDAASCGYIPLNARTKSGKINSRAVRIE